MEHVQKITNQDLKHLVNLIGIDRFVDQIIIIRSERNIDTDSFTPTITVDMKINFNLERVQDSIITGNPN